MSSPGDLPDPGIHLTLLSPAAGGWVLYRHAKPVNLGERCGLASWQHIRTTQDCRSDLAGIIDWTAHQPAVWRQPTTSIRLLIASPSAQ